MPIESYTVDRVGTKREHARADFADPEAVRTVPKEMATQGPSRSSDGWQTLSDEPSHISAGVRPGINVANVPRLGNV